MNRRQNPFLPEAITSFYVVKVYMYTDPKDEFHFILTWSCYLSIQDGILTWIEYDIVLKNIFKCLWLLKHWGETVLYTLLVTHEFFIMFLYTYMYLYVNLFVVCFAFNTFILHFEYKKLIPLYNSVCFCIIYVNTWFYDLLRNYLAFPHRKTNSQFVSYKNVN